MSSTFYPSVSVIIPCYNHGKYLAQAIKSSYAQEYPDIEIIVVDDGSTDNSADVARSFPSVRYFLNDQKGVSSARNKGIDASNGEYLVFLDADDWLLPGACSLNARVLRQHPDAAFVYGGHHVQEEESPVYWLIQPAIEELHYLHLLESNFIGMLAAVMFRRTIFDSYRFDTSLSICEDYELYLRIAKDHSCVGHNHPIAVYRYHSSNTSGNYIKVVEAACSVIEKQQPTLHTSIEREYCERGFALWKQYYGDRMYTELVKQLYNRQPLNESYFGFLKENDPDRYTQLIQKKKFHQINYYMRKIRSVLQRYLPGWLLQLLGIKDRRGRINFGDLNSTSPLSVQFGYDRGGPVDRFYIEQFLDRWKDEVKGNTLEIGDNEYTLQYGRGKVTKSDILHIDDSNKAATYIGDLSNAPQLPSDHFDCIILTQTLHLIYDYKAAIETCYRILKKGGILLLTVPGISQIGQDGWRKYWLWSFTDTSLNRIMKEHFPGEELHLSTYGNVQVATAFLYGMGLPELDPDVMRVHDPHFQVTIAACARK